MKTSWTLTFNANRKGAFISNIYKNADTVWSRAFKILQYRVYNWKSNVFNRLNGSDLKSPLKLKEKWSPLIFLHIKYIKWNNIVVFSLHLESRFHWKSGLHLKEFISILEITSFFFLRDFTNKYRNLIRSSRHFMEFGIPIKKKSSRNIRHSFLQNLL